MIPVFQTIFDADSGNCLTASLASILKLPIESVPDFAKEHGDDCLKAAAKWLNDRGLRFISIGFDDYNAYLWAYFACHGNYCVLVGPSNYPDRGHAVVGRVNERGRVEVAHDPIPGGSGPVEGGFRWVHFIVPVSGE